MSSQLANRPLRIVFYRPHIEIWFKNPVHHLLRGDILPHKYESFFDSLLISGAEVSISTALFRSKGWKGLVRYLLDPFLLIFWALGNKISLNKLSFVFNKRMLRHHDVLFFMHYGNFTYEDAASAKRGRVIAEALSDIDILKVGHFTHYAYQPEIGADNLKKLQPNLLVAENNLLSNSNFYNKYFGDLNVDFWCLPFIAAQRFQSHTAFDQRQCKLVATGSITFKMTDPDFINFFGTNELQPLRRLIYEHAHEYSDEIDCMISDLNATRQAGTKTKQPFLRRLMRRQIPNPRNFYYQRNIVDIYNSYMMFTVPEEVCDLPAVGVFEGMACGCAFFGIDSPMYKDLGMIPGMHYVAHDGTLVDLVKKVQFYQQPEQYEKLESIARNGAILVDKALRAEVVYSKFVERLTNRINQTQYT